MEHHDLDCDLKALASTGLTVIHKNQNIDAEDEDQCSHQFLKCKPKDKSIPAACDDKNKHKILERTTNKYFSDNSDCSSRNNLLKYGHSQDTNSDFSDSNGACGFHGNNIEAYLNQNDTWIINWKIDCPQSGDFIALCPVGKHVHQIA